MAPLVYQAGKQPKGCVCVYIYIYICLFIYLSVYLFNKGMYIYRFLHLSNMYKIMHIYIYGISEEN